MRKGSSKASRPLLLDVNVLLALAWPNHQFHFAAVERLEQNNDHWATCALTELGFVRLSSNPSVVGVVKTPAEAAALLKVLVGDSRHIYVGELPSPTGEPFLEYFDRSLTSKHVTDAYLVGLAERNKARLLTFDGRLAALARSSELVEVLEAQ